MRSPRAGLFLCAGIGLGGFLLSACGPQAAPASAPRTQPESLEKQEARLDATVWRDELNALEHERTFITLRNELRNATNKIAVLGGFEFDEISLPKPAPPGLLNLGI